MNTFKKYIVRFEFYAMGEWKEDYLTNNGNGFIWYDATYIAQDFNLRENIRNAHIEEVAT